MDCSLPGSSVHGDSPGKNTTVGWPWPPPGDLPSPGTEPRSRALQADSLPSKPPRKPSLSLPSLILVFIFLVSLDSNRSDLVSLGKRFKGGMYFLKTYSPVWAKFPLWKEIITWGCYWTSVGFGNSRYNVCFFTLICNWTVIYSNWEIQLISIRLFFSSKL